MLATCILLRIQKKYGIEFIKNNVKDFLAGLGIVFFLVTAIVTIFNFYEKHLHMKVILTSANQMRTASERSILCVEPFREVSFPENLISGLHIPNYNLSTDENSWENVAFARYYGIKGIRIKK